MPGARRQGREAALQVLYLNDISRNTLREVPEPVWSAEPLTPTTREFAARLAEGVSAHQSVIDPLINKYAENWEIGRIATIGACRVAPPANVVVAGRQQPRVLTNP